MHPLFFLCGDSRRAAAGKYSSRPEYEYEKEKENESQSQKEKENQSEPQTEPEAGKAPAAKCRRGGLTVLRTG